MLTHDENENILGVSKSISKPQNDSLQNEKLIIIPTDYKYDFYCINTIFVLPLYFIAHDIPCTYIFTLNRPVYFSNYTSSHVLRLKNTTPEFKIKIYLNT